MAETPRRAARREENRFVVCAFEVEMLEEVER